MVAKFVNISTRRVQLFWDLKNDKPGSPMGLMGPFESTGTASFPQHAFYVTNEDEGSVLARFKVDPPTSVYYYDDITMEGNPGVTQRNMDSLSMHTARTSTRASSTNFTTNSQDRSTWHCTLATSPVTRCGRLRTSGRSTGLRRRRLTL
jgi:hypothetical protein